MEEIIGILFALLVFLGPVLLKFIGSAFGGDEAPGNNRPPVQTPAQAEFAEKLKRHRQKRTPKPVDAIIVAERAPAPMVHTATGQGTDAYYNTAAAASDAIEQRDDAMDSHLHQVFDHSLGTLRREKPTSRVQEDVLHTEDLAELPKESLAASIAATMKNKNDIRKAFILGEILQRPAALKR